MFSVSDALRTDLEGLRDRYTASYVTVAASTTFSLLYLTRPSSISDTLLIVLATHWAWSLIQGALAVLLLIGQWHGGSWMRLMHGIGLGVQTFYALMWAASGLVLGDGFFVAVGVFCLATLHWTLARKRWPIRKKKGRASGQR